MKSSEIACTNMFTCSLILQQVLQFGQGPIQSDHAPAAQSGNSDIGIDLRVSWLHFAAVNQGLAVLYHLRQFPISAVYPLNVGH
jgi:hypothetical protein